MSAKISFNKEQQEFIDRIKDDYSYDYYDNITRAGILTLNAPAGTGKTTVVKELHKVCHHVKILAPTHKAVKVLDPNGSMKVKTVHSFLGATSSYDDEGNIFFTFKTPKKGKEPLSGMLIIVDECSMITDEMFKEFSTLSVHNLVVFVGDDLQLPPVDSNHPIDQIGKRSLTFSVSEQWNLTQNMRAREKRSTDMLQLARDACYELRMPARMPEQSVDAMLQTFVDHQFSDKSVIMLAYSNAKVNEYNKMIRERLFLKDKSEQLKRFYVGEKLVFGSGVRFEKKMHVKYYSSDIIQVQSIEQVTLSIPFQMCDCKPAEWKRTKCAKHGFYKGERTLDFYHIIDQHDTTWYKPVDPTKFEPLQTQYRKYCIDLKSGIAWGGYYQWVNLYNADLKYNYSMTVHKSQGSEYHTVFVHRYNLERCAQSNQLLKVCAYYTAISRMREEVYDIVRN
jgi:exodeoxyribonuclease-5